MILRLPRVLLIGVATALAMAVGAAGSVVASRAATVSCSDSPSDQAAVQSAIDGGGSVVLVGHCLGTWTVTNNVTLTTTGGAVLDGGGRGSVLTVTNAASVAVNGLTIENGLADFGGGLYADAGSTVTMANTRIVDNTAVTGGGGIYVQNLALVEIDGSSIKANRAGSFGGGIAVTDAYLSITDSAINTNSAGMGGGIAAQSADAELVRTQVAGNKASDYAGGIASFNSGQVDTGIAIRDQTGASDYPFAPPSYLNSAMAASPTSRVLRVAVPTGVTLLNASVDHNNAPGQGGGGIVNVGAGNSSLFTLIDSSVSFNNAPAPNATGAGGIANVGGGSNSTAILNISGSQLIGNLTRHGDGGAIYNVSQGGTSLLTINDTSISSGGTYLNPNQAALGGGIYQDATNGPASTILNAGADIVHNKAFINGGGVYDLCGATLTRNPGSLVLLNTPNNLYTAACPSSPSRQ